MIEKNEVEQLNNPVYLTEKAREIASHFEGYSYSQAMYIVSQLPEQIRLNAKVSISQSDSIHS